MKCNFVSDLDKAEKLRTFLRRYGDKLPDSAIQKAVEGENLKNWATECDEKGEVISGVTWESNDWYLCTFHFLATKPEERGKGLATKVMSEAFDKAKRNPTCHVMSADITFDNEPSKRVIKKFGFEEKTRFCWSKGEKPADILHYVLVQPDGNEC